VTRKRRGNNTHERGLANLGNYLLKLQKALKKSGEGHADKEGRRHPKKRERGEAPKKQTELLFNILSGLNGRGKFSYGGITEKKRKHEGEARLLTLGKKWGEKRRRKVVNRRGSLTKGRPLLRRTDQDFKVSIQKKEDRLRKGATGEKPWKVLSGKGKKIADRTTL